MKAFECMDEIMIRGEADLMRLVPNFTERKDFNGCDYDMDEGIINKSMNRINGRTRKALSGKRSIKVGV